MSYRLINANDLNGKISEEDYKVVLDAPCIYADLPNGLDNEYHEISEWIPCKERLPEESGEYFITIDYGSIHSTDLSWFYPKDQTWSHKNANVIAWMPKPEPYKGGE